MSDDFFLLKDRSDRELAALFDTSLDGLFDKVTDEIGRRQRNGKWTESGYPDCSKPKVESKPKVVAKRIPKREVEAKQQIEAYRKVCKLIAIAILEKPRTSNHPAFIPRHLIKRLEIALMDAGFNIHKIRQEIAEVTKRPKVECHGSSNGSSAQENPG